MTSSEKNKRYITTKKTTARERTPIIFIESSTRILPANHPPSSSAVCHPSSVFRLLPRLNSNPFQRNGADNKRNPLSIHHDVNLIAGTNDGSVNISYICIPALNNPSNL